MNDKLKYPGDRHNLNSKEVHFNMNYPESIPEAKNESSSQLNYSLKDIQKNNKLQTPLKLENIQPYPSPRKSPQRPLTKRSDDGNIAIDSERRGFDFKNQSRSQQSQINYYASDYDYYEMRLTQRNSGSANEINKEDQLNTSRQIDNINDKSDLNASYLFDLQTIINNSKPNDTIRLPELSVRVYQLKITKPLTIIGSASSSIDVSHSINIDLSSYNKPNRGVIFSECAINFEFLNKKSFLNQSLSTRRSKESEEYKMSEKISYSEHNQTNLITGQLTTDRGGPSDRVYPLFIISPGTVVDVRDCHFTSKNNQLAHHPFQDVCFYLNQNRVNPNENQPCLRVQSTVVNNFFIAVQNSICGKIILEKLFVSNNHGHAINISNPYTLSIRESIIDSPGKSCINIRFSKDISSKEPRNVLIEKNELFKGSYGISIFGENMDPYSCILTISENKIYQNNKDGVGIKNLNISKLSIERNQIVDNGGNGLFLNHVLDTINFLQVTLKDNKILDSKLYGITLVDVAVFSEKDEIMRNHKGGILVSGQEKAMTPEEAEFYRNYPLRNIFSTTKINNNKDSGLQVIGALRGPLILNACELYENMNGVYIKQDPLNFNTNDASLNRNKNLSKYEDQKFGDIVLEKCVLFQNRLSGVHIKSITTKLYLRNSTIHDNKSYAVFFQNEDQKEHVVFKDSEKLKVREHISGSIGGNWGNLYDNNTASCKGSKCTIF